MSELLHKLKTEFVKLFNEKLADNVFQSFKFDAPFAEIRANVEKQTRKTIEGPVKKTMRSFSETAKYKTTVAANEELQSGVKAGTIASRSQAAENCNKSNDGDVEVSHSLKGEEKIKRLKALDGRGRGRGGSPSKVGVSARKPAQKKLSSPSRPGAKEKLDFSDGTLPSQDSFANQQIDDALVGIDGATMGELGDDVGVKKISDKGVFSYFKALTGVGGAIIDEKSLAPVLDKMREDLIGKNVASDIAQHVCSAVQDKLRGTAKGTFAKIQSVVQQATEETLTGILTPKRRIDILRDVLAAREKKEPYVIVFCGVNGVGKSTNLAKVCYWLSQNENSVLVAACDTFRAGAVEQLRTHEQKLMSLQKANGKMAKVKLYEKGYGKDAAGIASDAIRFGRDEGFDVVLVDTAGRMQDNEPLMRALAKLVKNNNPNLVLFVGEALVGNEAVDQLTKFNKALADNSDDANPRLIDGIVLTKFDTVDDKVGSAISMTYTTGQPIVFVGTGQSYGDLKKLNVKSVVASLLG